MMCSGTRYSHEFFYTQDVSNFLVVVFFLFWLFLSGGWRRLLGLQSRCVSASNKI